MNDVTMALLYARGFINDSGDGSCVYSCSLLLLCAECVEFVLTHMYGHTNEILATVNGSSW